MRKFRKMFPVLVGYLFILLFVYAAVSKLLDFNTFRNQLGQSPLLSAYAGAISWLVPILEIGISFMLIIPKFRMTGLYAAFSLMVMFTIYIFIILNFSPFVPCSCGGVLEKLGWIEHLIFNMVFIALASLAIFSYSTVNNAQLKKVGWKLFALIVVSIGVVTVLFISSEKQIKRNNAFIRRYVPHPVKQLNTYELPYNSYYIAGIEGKNIYLGNVSSPLHFAIIDTSLKKLNEQKIEINDRNFPFQNVRVKVVDSILYLSDGTVPIVFRGSINTLEVAPFIKNVAYFSQMQPTDAHHFTIRTLAAGTKEHVLGVIKKGDGISLRLTNELLKKQVDGFFDTDGVLLWNESLKKQLYVYYYRNEYFVFDKTLSLDFRGKTIDTISKAQISFTGYSSNDTKKLDGSTIRVNGQSFSAGRYLYITSKRLGKYEPASKLKKATIVDVYDLIDRSYAFSFYLFHKNGQAIQQFYIHKNILVALMGNQLVTYRLRATYFKSI